MTHDTNEVLSNIFNYFAETSIDLANAISPLEHSPNPNVRGVAAQVRNMSTILRKTGETIAKNGLGAFPEDFYKRTISLHERLMSPTFEQVELDKENCQIIIPEDTPYIALKKVEEINSLLKELLSSRNQSDANAVATEKRLAETLGYIPTRIEEAVKIIESEKDSYYQGIIADMGASHQFEMDTERFERKNAMQELFSTWNTIYSEECKDRKSAMRLLDYAWKATYTEEQKDRISTMQDIAEAITDELNAREDARAKNEEEINRIWTDKYANLEQAKIDSEEEIHTLWSAKYKDLEQAKADSEKQLITSWQSRFDTERSERLAALEELSTEAALELFERDNFAQKVLHETWQVNAIRMGQIKSYLDFLIEDQGIEVDYSNGRPEILAEHTPEVAGLQDAIDGLYFIKARYEISQRTNISSNRYKKKLLMKIGDLFNEIETLKETVDRNETAEANLILQAAHYHERATYFGGIVAELFEQDREVVYVEGQEFVRGEIIRELLDKYDKRIAKLEYERDSALERETAALRSKARGLAKQTSSHIDKLDYQRKIEETFDNFQTIVENLPAIMEDAGVTELSPVNVREFFTQRGVTIDGLNDLAQLVLVEDRLSENEQQLDLENQVLIAQNKDQKDQITRYEKRIADQSQNIEALQKEILELYKTISDLKDTRDEQDGNLLKAGQLCTSLNTIVERYRHSKLPSKDWLIAQEAQKTRKARDETDSLRGTLEETLRFVQELEQQVEIYEGKIENLEGELKNSYDREKAARTLAFKQREHMGYLLDALEKYGEVFVNPPQSEEDIAERISTVQLTKDLISGRMRGTKADENTELYQKAIIFGEYAEKILGNTLRMLKDYKLEKEKRELAEGERDEAIEIAHNNQVRVLDLEESIKTNFLTERYKGRRDNSLGQGNGIFAIDINPQE
jgi:hypothetical protein